MYELSQRFIFEAAHTLDRPRVGELEMQGSRNIHGHTYLAEVTVSGERDVGTGMVADLGVLRAAIEDVRRVLDHRFLDDVRELGPATLENLCSFIAQHMKRGAFNVSAVRVWREASGDSCRLVLG